MDHDGERCGKDRLPEPAAGFQETFFHVPVHGDVADKGAEKLFSPEMKKIKSQLHVDQGTIGPPAFHLAYVLFFPGKHLIIEPLDPHRRKIDKIIEGHGKHQLFGITDQFCEGLIGLQQVPAGAIDQDNPLRCLLKNRLK